MTTSLSFDRAAGFYDSTRDLPEPVATRGIEAILNAAGAGARFLDVGTGTGRISVPLLKRGADLVGCDLSPKMMAILRQKAPAARLVEADASELPFPARYFDAATTCHVMHLVGPWREALREYRRVLKPGGVYINARTETDGNPSTGDRVEDFWEARVAAHGASSRRPGIKSEDELHGELLQMGAVLEQVETVRYSRSWSLQEVLERIANRIDSKTWSIPEPVLQSTLRETQEWAAQEFGDLHSPFNEQSVFIIDVARFARGD